MGSLRRLHRYFHPYRSRIVWGLLFIIASNATFALVPRMIQEGLDSLQVDTGRSLAWYFSAIVGLALVSTVCRFFIRQRLIIMSRLMEYDLRQDLWQHVQAMDAEFFQQRPTGELMAFLSNDVDAVRMYFGPVVMYTLDNLCRFIFFLSLMIFYNGWLTLYAMAPLLILAVAIYVIMPIVHRRFKRIQEAFADMTARVQQDVAGIQVLKSYNRETHEGELFADISRDYYHKQMALVRTEAAFRPLIFIIPSLSAVAIIWFGGKLVASGTGPDAFTVGQLTAFMFCLSQLVWPMVALGWVFNIAQRANASAGRIQTIFDHAPQIEDGPETDQSITALTGEIELRDVSLRYRDDGPAVLDGLSLRIPAGTTCAIIGRTGSGKSSLVHLLPRFREITGGDLLIDGNAIGKIPLSVLRGHIGFATQEPFLFSDTLSNNIAFARPDASPEEVERASEIAGFAGDVAEFTDGYESRVGERGLTLSGGQKQRCALARALLADPRILILDDTFSAVDTDTEEGILRSLREFMKDRTTIFISHRISTVRDADQILVLDGGKIIEKGTHAELVANGGLYSEFERKQRLASEIEDF